MYYRKFENDGSKSGRGRLAHALKAHAFSTALAVIICSACVSGLRAYFVAASHKQSSQIGHENLERVGLRPEQRAARQEIAQAAPMRLPFEPRVSAAVLAGAKYSKLRANSSYPDDLWRNVTVRVGDNLSLIFNRVGASRSDLQQVLDTDKNAGVALTKLEPGQVTRFRFEQSKLLEFIYEQDYLTSLRLVLDGPHSNANWIKSKPEIRVASAVAEINHSVFIDGQKAGLLDKTIMEFINVFGWDVDFLRDLQRGDRFSIVFEELYKDGEKIGNGKILAAEFVNNGKQLRALHYQNESGVAGYFSDKGEAMRKAFLRTPVNFTRISSRFSLARKHPILNRIRAHKGVDYSAPMGTPIQAVADGKAEFVGWQGGYGRVVVLKHGATYSTLYGHMSRFARGLRTSSSISQGQTIGFVGKTGLATGPHLHYEFRVDNQHRDPLTVKFPNSLPLDGKFKDDFQRKSSAMLARLDSLRETPSTEDKSLVAKAELIHKPFRQPN